MPPVRVLFAGDDQQFNDFLALYVENVLLITANLVKDEEFANQNGGDPQQTGNPLHHRRSTQVQPTYQQSSQQ